MTVCLSAAVHSLHLFEHIHGESRDRGQAMVDLQQQYHTAGLDIGVKELPDYLPLYLGFYLPKAKRMRALGWKNSTDFIGTGLPPGKTQQPYAGLFHCLILLSGWTLISMNYMHSWNKKSAMTRPKHWIKCGKTKW